MRLRVEEGGCVGEVVVQHCIAGVLDKLSVINKKRKID